MPQVTLTSSSVAYNLYSLLSTADKQIQRSVAGLNIQLPDIAANAGATVKVGRPDSISAPTDVTNVEVLLGVDQAFMFPQDVANNVSLTERWVKGSVNNEVLYCSVVQA